MNPGDKLLLNLRIMGEPRDLMEEPYLFDVKEGVMLLYSEPENALDDLGIPYAGYNLDIVEHFQIIPAEDVEDMEQAIEQSREPVRMKDMNVENPFQGGKLRFKDSAA